MRHRLRPPRRHNPRIPLPPTHLRPILQPQRIPRDRRIGRDQLRRPPEWAAVDRPRLQELGDAFFVGSGGREAVRGDEGLAFLDDEAAVAVDVSADGEDGDAAVVDVEGGEDGAGESV